MATITRGTPVRVKTAGGTLLNKVASSGPERGVSIEVVWVCRPEEWEAAEREQRDPDCVPWPAYAVEAA